MTASISMDTTAPRVNRNAAGPLAGYSLRGFLQFITHNTGQLVVAALFLLLAFGQKLFSNTFSIGMLIWRHPNTNLLLIIFC